MHQTKVLDFSVLAYYKFDGNFEGSADSSGLYLNDAFRS